MNSGIQNAWFFLVQSRIDNGIIKKNFKYTLTVIVVVDDGDDIKKKNYKNEGTAIYHKAVTFRNMWI